MNMVFLVFMGLALMTCQDSAKKPAKPAPATQPTSQPATSQATTASSPSRVPDQSRILQELLRQTDRPVTAPNRTTVASAAGSRANPKDELLIEGQVLVERSVRLVHSGDHFELKLTGEKPTELLSLEVLKNSQLELMENDASAGLSQFIVSMEVTRYRGRNFVLIRNYRRQIDNGNLTP